MICINCCDLNREITEQDYELVAMRVIWMAEIMSFEIGVRYYRSGISEFPRKIVGGDAAGHEARRKGGPGCPEQVELPDTWETDQGVLY